jgi:hypothetical protein
MSALTKIIKEYNAFASRKIDSRQITMGDALIVFNHIDNQLEPEWLYQDGEASFYEVQDRSRLLKRAAKELVLKGFRVPDNIGNFPKWRKLGPLSNELVEK